MAKSQNPKPKVQIFEHKPAKTIAGAIAASKAHVAAANKAK
jgi:hypothetical protein